MAFVDSRKGKLLNRSGGVTAFVDHYAPVHLNGETFETENEITRLKERMCNLIQKSESVDEGLYGDLATK